MKLFFKVLFLLSLGTLHSDCTEADCGPPLGMPNYLCADGETIAGPGDCLETANGDCTWEIVSCPQSTQTGYLKLIEFSTCMDTCAYYYLETEFGDYISNVTDLDNIESLSYFDHRYVTLSGEDVWCVECGAVDVSEIAISGNCEIPVDCFQDPCIDASCSAFPNAECVSTYCGGCHADFYQNGELITDCTTDINCNDFNSCSDCTDSGCFWQPYWEPTPGGYGTCADECMIADLDCYGETDWWIAACPEYDDCIDLGDIYFGPCDMILGIGFINGSCDYISGCAWNDYSDAFFETIDECEAACFDDQLTCDEIAAEYELLHFDEYAVCEYDMDCMAVWGDCDVGLGGCHYSVNAEFYPEEEINHLVDLWIEDDCMEWVCDCSTPPYAQCINNECISAYCFGDNPAGCQQTGCADGYDCVVNANDCISSYCECDGFYSGWFCTEDCGGGTCVASMLLGDMNNDGVINVVDIVIAVDYILNDVFNPLGDMNDDGSLNVVDIILMVNQVLG